MRSHLRLRWALVPALAVAGLLGASTGALAQTGGSTPPGSTTTTPPPTTTTPPPTTTPGVATLQADGSALAPPDAPRQVRKAINAANRIRFKPYLWGGGHRSFKAKGYDCSGAVSYVLHAAGLLKKPMDSGTFARSWGSYGVGQWITVYANRSHAYMTIAGLRYDTSGAGEPLNSGSGPRWRSTQRMPTGYTSKYYLGL